MRSVLRERKQNKETPLVNAMTPGGAAFMRPVAAGSPDLNEADFQKNWDAEFLRVKIQMVVDRLKKSRVSARQIQIYLAFNSENNSADDVVAALGCTRQDVYNAESRVGPKFKAEWKRLEEAEGL
jgi:hypothetical protein